MSGSPKSYRRAKLSKENAERLAQGMQPKEMRGRFGVHIPHITDVPELLAALVAMNTLAKGPSAGVTQAQKREVIAAADAAIAKAMGVS
jgi:hypothetical protein